MGQRIHVYIFFERKKQHGACVPCTVYRVLSHYSPEYSKPIETEHEAHRVDVVSREGAYGNIAKYLERWHRIYNRLLSFISFELLCFVLAKLTKSPSPIGNNTTISGV
jgi:hypothetical protein